MQTIKELIVDSGKLTPEAYQQALALVTSKKFSLLHAIETLNVMDEQSLLGVFAHYYQVPVVELDKIAISPEILDILPKAFCLKHRIIPIERAGNNLIIATGDPRNFQTIDAVRFKSGYFPKPILASELKITAAIDKFYGKMNLEELSEQAGEISTAPRKAARTDITDQNINKDDGPVIKLVNDIILQCIDKSASDVHIESYEDAMRVRLRIDGSLVDIAHPPLNLKGPLISRIKIMAGLNIAETRLPQDGAINLKIGEKPVDFRVNSLPTSYGEKIVLRVLDKENLQVDMTKLGFESDQLGKFTEAIRSPNGIILVTGPTGSGKTTTLYSVLQELNDEESNIVTAEDPIEYNLPGINQVQVKPEIGLNFSEALRAFLRQDPDIIMLGEIRDLETAEISIKAALTGHLVLSTLHTNNAIETVTRLLNMGVASYNLVAALKCVTAQRLLKMICTRCREIDSQVDKNILLGLGIHPSAVDKVNVYRGKGCTVCSGSGTKGRIAIHEVLVLDEEIKRAILNGVSAIDLKKLAIARGMHTLRQSAVVKLAKGLVPLSEVLKETSSDTE